MHVFVYMPESCAQIVSQILRLKLGPTGAHHSGCVGDRWEGDATYGVLVATETASCTMDPSHQAKQTGPNRTRGCNWSGGNTYALWRRHAGTHHFVGDKSWTTRVGCALRGRLARWHDGRRTWASLLHLVSQANSVMHTPNCARLHHERAGEHDLAIA